MSDRKSSRSSIFIKRPFVSVIGTMQKRILSELAKGERSANGFIDRILFVLLRHEKSTRWSMKQPTFDVAAEWQRILSRLMELECTVDENNDIIPATIPFTDEAMTRLFSGSTICRTFATEAKRDPCWYILQSYRSTPYVSV